MQADKGSWGFVVFSPAPSPETSRRPYVRPSVPAGPKAYPRAADGSYRGFEKTEISALCGAGLSPQVQGMRQVEPESKRDVLPARKPKQRWAFPDALFAGWIGQEVRIQLLNGSVWTGFLRWNSRFTFLLGAQPEGEPEVLLFKHACCGVHPVGPT